MSKGLSLVLRTGESLPMSVRDDAIVAGGSIHVELVRKTQGGRVQVRITCTALVDADPGETVVVRLPGKASAAQDVSVILEEKSGQRARLRVLADPDTRIETPVRRALLA